jgi:ribosomal protein RSM22 (predicted rRNA methylase)
VGWSQDPDALQEAALASAQWSRIVRPPRRHAKHVVIDLCSARATPPNMPNQSGGAPDVDRSPSGGILLQQTISGADKKGWLGPAGYRLARKVRWGDLWPAYLQDRALTKLLAVPESVVRKKRWDKGKPG